MEQAAASVSTFDRRGDRRSFNQPLVYVPRERSQRKQNDKGTSLKYDDSSFNGNTERYAEGDECQRNASFSGRSDSNLKRFLVHTTPTLSCQHFSKTCVRDLSLKGCIASSRYFFSLRDLWDSFDEWSAYGAGVPIVLNGKETVMQYYVPYVSALQLYSNSASGMLSTNRRLGDDSDGSEMDFRDTSSEASSDGEPEKAYAHDGRTGFSQLRGDFGVHCGQASIRNWHGQWSSVGVADDEERWQLEMPESLIYEYFESVAPSFRVPLYDKIEELARQFPALKTLRSNELSRSSWLSVAWYPIYRIPTGPTLKDLAACFLTYHRLSTLLPGLSKGIAGNMSRESSVSLSKHQVALHPFGLATYKFRGAIWTSNGVADRHDAVMLQRSSDEWLKRLHVQHPDYEYFVSHSNSVQFRVPYQGFSR